MSHTQSLLLECAQNIPEHAKVLYAWRMDPETQKMSFRGTTTNEDAFWTLFQDYFVLKDLPSLFAVHDGQRVAFVGFTPYESKRRAAEVSIVVAQERRGEGIGGALLEAVSRFAKQQGYEELYALIKPMNTKSIRIFEKAGFLYTKECEHEVEGVAIPAKLYCLSLRPQTEPQQVFIIGEAGSNWRMGSYARDLKMAHALIKVAKEADCDAVKFQTYRPETVYVSNAGISDYLETKEDISAIFEDLAMPYEMIKELAQMCTECGIEFMSTAFSEHDFEAVDPFVRRHKIASYELSHVRLLALAAKSQKPLILSTGASTLSDIRWAYAFFKAQGGKKVTLLQCSAQYPAAPQAMNLQAITTLQRTFGCPVGLSDHSRDPLVAPIAAVALGARCIEKHFTLDRRLPGPDHSFAVEPDELKAMCAAIRETEAMLGTGVKEVLEEEKELFAFAKRRVQALTAIKAGERLEEGKNVAILRPGKQKPGCHPKYIDEVVGKRATRGIPMGEGIALGDWQ